MSFQDFSSSGRNGRAGAAGTTAANNRAKNVPPAPNSAGSSSIDSSSSPILNQISEALLQYQRNVGILEKIVQSLAIGVRQQRRATLTTEDELNLQYQAQVDVIGQLEDKVRRLLLRQQQQQSTTTGNSNATAATTGPVVKLRRDFERVQARAQALKSGVERLKREQDALQASYRRQQQQGGAAAALAANSSALASGAGGGAAASEMDHYEQVQLQLQQDRLADEIMREREEEIRNINRGMHQVNEIYRDLASIVSSQQEQVDVIETQMDDARTNAESGLEQVSAANEKYGQSQCTIS